MSNLEIREGRYYRTRDGQKVGPMQAGSDHYGPNSWLGFVDGQSSYCSFKLDGSEGQRLDLDLIAEWTDAPAVDLTAITTPFGLLDAETQAALRAHGGPYQWVASERGWTDWGVGMDINSGHAHLTIRVKPAPPKPREWWVTYDHGKIGVFEFPVRRDCYQEVIHVREVIPE